MNEQEQENGSGAAILAAAIAAGAGLVSNWWTNRQNRKNWELQNEYNAPVQQMARYRAAGLSPNLIYSNGQASSGNATSLPPYQSQRISSNDLLNAAQAVMNMRTMSANVKKLMLNPSRLLPPLVVRNYLITALKLRIITSILIFSNVMLVRRLTCSM